MIEERRFARSSAMRLLYSWSMGDEEQLMTLKMLYEDGNMTLDAGQQRYIDRVDVYKRQAYSSSHRRRPCC